MEEIRPLYMARTLRCEVDSLGAKSVIALQAWTADYTPAIGGVPTNTAAQPQVITDYLQVIVWVYTFITVRRLWIHLYFFLHVMVQDSQDMCL